MSLLFQNFQAADRKRHLKRFRLATANADLSWIDSLPAGVPTIEVPTGTINGSNADFTISSSDYAELVVILNGLVLNLGQGYSLPAVNTIRFAAGYIPQPSGVDGRTEDDAIKAVIWENT